MKRFRRFLIRIWARLKAMCQITVNTTTSDIEVDQKLVDVLKDMKCEAKKLAREKLAIEGHIPNRNTYRTRLEDEARRIFERIVSLSFEPTFVVA